MTQDDFKRDIQLGSLKRLHRKAVGVHMLENRIRVRAPYKIGKENYQSGKLAETGSLVLAAPVAMGLIAAAYVRTRPSSSQPKDIAPVKDQQGSQKQSQRKPVTTTPRTS